MVYLRRIIERLRAFVRGPQPLLYRPIKHRAMDEDGNVVVLLSCGHQLRLVPARRDALPCQDCAEARARQAGGTQAFAGGKANG